METESRGTFRWAGSVGAAYSDHSEGRSIGTPAAASFARAAESERRPGRPFRSVATTAWARSPRMRSTRPERTDPGPTSMNVRAPAAYMASIISTKRTGAAICAARWSRMPSGLATYGVAVALDQTGTLGAAVGTPSRWARSGSVAAATIGEWKAVATGSLRARTPRSRRAASKAEMASVEPERTTCFGPLWLATVTSAPISATRARTASTGLLTTVIAPGISDAWAISSPRRRATETTSVAESVWAACRAVTSPRLWPATIEGVIPSVRSSSRVATLVHTMAGWAHSVAVSRRAWAARVSSSKAPGGKTTSWSGRVAAVRSHGARAASKRIARSAPMPTYWLPWPGKMKAISPGRGPTPKWAPSGVANGASGARSIRSASRLSASPRPASSVATSARRAGAVASKSWCELCASQARTPSVVAAAAIARAARATSAPLSPLSTMSSWVLVRSRGARPEGRVYSSRATWKFEPPKPKALTPARRGWSSPRIQGRADVLM